MNPQMITLNLTVQQLNTVMAALGELPFKVSNDLIQELFKQFNEQQPKQDAANE